MLSSWALRMQGLPVLKAKFEPAPPKINEEKQKVIVITGPTGVGKSALGIDLAIRLNGEIISADSVQVYKGLDVGSAKTPELERQNVPHHLLDVLEPTHEYSAFRFLRDAREATAAILSRGHVPIVVGGAAFYLLLYIHAKPAALDLEVFEEKPASVDAKMNFKTFGPGLNSNWDIAMRHLAQVGDPESAERLARGDWSGLRRALRILRVTGKPQGSFPLPWELSLYNNADQWDYDYRCYFLYAMQSVLFPRIDLRCEKMLADPRGLLQEASWLLSLGITPNSNPPSKAIGYRHAMEYIEACRSVGGVTTPLDFSKFLSSFQMASRNYAKQQMTWFRDDPNFTWLNSALPREALLQSMEEDFKDSWGSCKLPSAWEILQKSSARQAELRPRPPRQYFPKNRIYTGALAWTQALEWMRNA